MPHFSNFDFFPKLYNLEFQKSSFSKIQSRLRRKMTEKNEIQLPSTRIVLLRPSRHGHQKRRDLSLRVHGKAARKFKFSFPAPPPVSNLHHQPNVLPGFLSRILIVR